MDSLKAKINKNKKILAAYIRELAEEKNNALGNDLTYQAIIDLTSNHFQLVRIGWHENKYIYNILIHLDINPDTGNIWVQQNNTEILLDDELRHKGIPKNNFVLGFRPAAMRSFSDFAVA